jgi:hypothetical protein
LGAPILGRNSGRAPIVNLQKPVILLALFKLRISRHLEGGPMPLQKLQKIR